MHKNSKIGHRQRLKDRIIKSKTGTIPEYDILEVLLFSARPLGDVRPIAHALIKRFGNLFRVINADEYDLLQVEGVTLSVVAVIKAIKEALRTSLLRSVEKKVILSDWKALLNFLRMSIGGKSIEHFMILYLNSKLTLIKDVLQDVGTVDQTPIYVREIVKGAIQCGASNIIVSHNHPSGSIEPSTADIKMTCELSSVCAVMNINLIDHIIVTQYDSYSFKNNDLL